MKISTKKKIKQTVTNFTAELLETVGNLSVLVPKPFESKHEHITRIRRTMNGYTPLQVSQGLYRLRKQGLIEMTKSNNQPTYALTLTGRHKYLMNKISHEKFSKRDGNSCIVIFDIPEEKSKYRRFLRKFLSNNGFINLQKSVLIGPQFLPKEFFELMSELGIRQNVTVIKGAILNL
jgi:DNA-binding transcriptional regulator PaaX